MSVARELVASGLFGVGATLFVVAIMLSSNGAIRPAATWAFLAALLAGVTGEWIRRRAAGRARATAAQTDDQERFRSCFTHSPLAIALLSPEQRFLLVNDAFRELLAYTAEDLAQKTLRDITHPSDWASVSQYLERTLCGTAENEQIETRLLRPGGKAVPVLAGMAKVCGADGALHHVVVQLQDLTERHTLETQFRQAQKMEAVGRLAAGIAHDFNNLLTVISTNSEFLLGSLDVGDERRADAEDIRAASARAARLTRQLLTFSRQQALHIAPVDVNAIVTSVESMLRRLIGTDVTLVTTLHTPLPIVQADAGQMEQVIVNLAVNARDAMPDGGTLTIETGSVMLDEHYVKLHPMSGPGAHVLLAVSDTGIGMDADTQTRIFEPFFTTKPPGEGTGLGLSTVYGIVKQFGGHLWVYSEIDQGTSFKIYLPVGEAAHPAEPEVAVRAPERSQGSRSETILVADDKDDMRRLSERVLRAQGYQVLSAATGGEAVRMAAQHAGSIDLIIADLVMPELGGRDVVGRIREERPGVRALFVSGFTDEEVARRQTVGSGDRFLQKPFTSDALAHAVRETLATLVPA